MKTVAQTALGVVIGFAIASALGAAAGPSKEVVTERLVIVNADGKIAGTFDASDGSPNITLVQGTGHVSLIAVDGGGRIDVGDGTTNAVVAVNERYCGCGVIEDDGPRAFIGTTGGTEQAYLRSSDGDLTWQNTAK